MQVRVKICGITSHGDLIAALDAGADAIGFVVDVPQSPRNLSIRTAKRLMAATPIFTETVVVAVPRDLDHLEHIYKQLKPGALQIYMADEHLRVIHERLSDVKVIGTVQIGAEPDFDAIVELAENCSAILVDTFVKDKYGGAGVPHNWEISQRIKGLLNLKPLILAGGLTPTNVQNAIRVVQPYAVDVSSGVEASPGVKSPKKVRQFIQNAKRVKI